ncbi:MAG: radical SAM protein [Verrucomicrobiales bacterium]|jgi:oxygen-independent coproporphyrinogen-3 oxidase|nr:radical SAM protein [Verrucomicrobiales bacterium]
MRPHLGGGDPVPADRARAAYPHWTPTDPLAVYLHIPFCRHRCAFCPFYLNRHYPGSSRDYTDLLLQEIALTPADRARPLRAIYLGGGTPGDLAAADLARLLTRLRATWRCDADTEITVETRLRGFTVDQARACLDAGATRFSLGVQTTDTRLRRSLGRLADREELLATLRQVGQLHGARLSADLLYGLPGQTPAMVREDIRLLATQTPLAAITFYELINFPASPMNRAITAGRLPPLPDHTQLAAIYHTAVAALAHAGFHRHTLVHWRRDPRETAAYNLHVKSGADLIPLGSGAGGIINGHQLTLTRDLAEYRALIHRGQKPIASATRLHPARRQLHSAISLALEHRRLPPFPGDKPISTLLRQWQTVNLLTPDHHLTPAGEFWSKTMEHHLLTATAQR